MINPIFLRRFSSDFVVFEEIFIDEIYKVNDSESIITTILDAGANIGMSALYFLRKYPNAKLVCVEPETKNFEILSKNLNGYKNVILIKKGLWSHKSFLAFRTLEGVGSWGFEVEETTKENAQIEAISVNDIILEHQINNFDFCKIDIEGSEKEVFDGNTDWLEEVKIMIIELHENMRAGSVSTVLAKMKVRNFRMKNLLNSNYFFTKIN